MTRTISSAAELLAKLPETSALFDKSTNEDYWRSFAPNLQVDGRSHDTYSILDKDFSTYEGEKIAATFESQGLLKLDSAVPLGVVTALRDCMVRLMASGWPALFIYIYDEAWALPRFCRVQSVLRRILGRDCKQIPELCVHYVNGRDGAKGFAPHVDGTVEEREPDRVNLWFALSDAGLETSCMYAIPRDRVGSELKWGQSTSFNDVKRWLQATVAMPVSAGGVLGWGTDVIHWGGIARNTYEPRVAISLQFVTANKVLPFRPGHLVDLAGPLPSHAERLRLIGHSMRRFHRRFPLAPVHFGLTHLLLDVSVGIADD